MTLHTRKAKKPTLNRQQRETLNFFKEEKRQEYITNISAHSGMNPEKLSKLGFKTLKEINEGIAPQVNESEAIEAMTPPSSADIIRNKRNNNTDETPKSDNPAVNAMTPKSTAEVIKQKRS
ncbi:hypothetical protein [Halalkalibaculum sp. DA384]|uniref:hypothetical protein n=1 Tax=Halalkalibaculum sp. DA384 TaxID=3373606 RepID=UPI0037542F8B